jgi:hypothetical protein
VPGNKLGRGRPRGSRNKAGSEAQELIDRFTPQLVTTCIGHAAKGDHTAMRLCMERILPARRHASAPLSLRRIRSPQDLEKAGEKVIQAIGRGKIAPAEGEIMMNALESQARIIEKCQFESRLQKIEENMAAALRPRAA